jgi:2,4-diketo-3-deoxy-L-fuconate hydrolase
MADSSISQFSLGTFSMNGGPRFPGLVVAGRVAPLSALRPLFDGVEIAPRGGSSVLQLLEDWDTNYVALQHAADLVAQSANSHRWQDISLPELQLRSHPPVDLPRQIFCAGANYRKHVIDLIVDQPTGPDSNLSRDERRSRAVALMDERAAKGAPFAFAKPASAVTGPFDPVILSRRATQPDWELELAVIIGKPARHVSRAKALDYVAGYTIVNDVTNRDLVFRKDTGAMGADWIAAKGSPSYLPMGPYLVPAAFIPDPQNLQITLKLNGDVMQDESTADMIFGVARIIEFLSANVQLWPGDLIATGSPAGNGTHYNRFLKPGDVMEGSITGLGQIRNECIADEAGAHAS